MHSVVCSVKEPDIGPQQVEHLGAIADAAPVMLWTMHAEPTLDWFNARWLAYTGRTLEDSRARGWLGDVHAEDIERCRGIFGTSGDARQPFTLDVRLRRHDARYHWVLVSATPRFNADGGFCGYIGSGIDIDARKHDEDRLAERLQALRHAERRQADFLALLSHELRGPLAPIANAASVLRTLEASNPILARLREIIGRQVTRLGGLIDGLIDTARSAQGQISLVSEAVAVNGLVHNALARSSEVVAAAHHTLDLHLPEQRVCIHGDPARLAQALSNLIANAAKFMPEPGVIKVAVEADATRVRITVKDQGQGIAPDFLPQVFELFAKQDATFAPVSAGLGVGLTLARRIARMHGGDIEARSAGAGQGAQFTMTLPRPSEQGNVAAVTPHAAGPDLAESYRVLIIEDDADAREALRLQMRLWGNEVMTAANGEEGLAAASEFEPHIVLCDIGLPGRDGLQLVAPLRQRLGPSVLFAAVTGHAGNTDEARALAGGFDSYLVKPLHSDGLAKLLRSYANRVH